MIVNNIEYSRNFCKDLKKLPADIKTKLVRTEQLFRTNPLHPGLRLHRLHGKLKTFWSISVTTDYRIIFSRIDDGVIVFFSVGKHDIYAK